MLQQFVLGLLLRAQPPLTWTVWRIVERQRADCAKATQADKTTSILSASAFL